MAAITLNNGSKITNLIQHSEIKFYTTGAQTFFADIAAGTVLPLTAQHTLNFIIISGAAQASLNGRFNVPGTETVGPDGELSIGTQNVGGVVSVNWHIKP